MKRGNGKKWPTMYNGERRTMKHAHQYWACCDCGLVHHYEFRVRKGKITYRASRANRSTAMMRRHRAHAYIPVKERKKNG